MFKSFLNNIDSPSVNNKDKKKAVSISDVVEDGTVGENSSVIKSDPELKDMKKEQVVDKNPSSGIIINNLDKDDLDSDIQDVDAEINVVDSVNKNIIDKDKKSQDLGNLNSDEALQVSKKSSEENKTVDSISKNEEPEYRKDQTSLNLALEEYNNQRLDDSLKSSFAKQKSKEELEKYARDTLREIAYIDSIYEGTADIISQSIYGYKGFFIGDKGGTKEDFIDSFADILYKVGKIGNSKPKRISFAEIPEKFNLNYLYVIDGIGDAVVTLFGTDDYSGDSSMDQADYRRKLDRLIKSPGSSYIVLSAEEFDTRGFKSLDSRIQYVFNKNVYFPNLSHEDIFRFFVEFLPHDFVSKKEIDDEWKKYFIEYLERNRRYFPFDNKELSIYLANYVAGKAKLELPAEKYDATTLDEAFANIVGLNLVKNQIKELQEYLITRQKLEKFGVKLPDFNLHMLLLGNPGSGKGVNKNTKILYSKGKNFIWKNIGDLKAGDIIIGGTGKPCNVLGVYPQPVKDFYEITFSDGIKKECSGDHLWRVQDRQGRRNTNRDKKLNKQVPKEQKYRVLETQEMYKDFRMLTKGDNRAKYSIDFVSPIEFPTKDLPIDPYVLGAFLGDGTITGKNISIASVDIDLIEKVRTGLKINFNGCNIAPRQDKKSYNITQSNDLKETLNGLGLLGAYSNTKFIPEEYLFASVDQRWELLRGLLDTNGSADKRGGYIEYVSVSKQLAKDVQQLVLSLGGQARWSVKEKPFYRNEHGEKVICQKAYRLIIMFCKEDGEKAFYLKRKKDIYKPKRLRKNIKRYITDIKPIEPQEGVCIAVDDPTHTYVIQNYIITHNTTMARIIAKVLFDIGYIKEDKLIEVTSKDLVAPTSGMTSTKANKVIMNAMGGVLFVDEAYSLAISSGTPGLEAITMLVKAMEDYKGEFVCIFAGYNLEMQQFVRSNSGIASRIAYTFEFEDYTQEELFEIFKVKLGLTGMKLDPDAIEPLVKVCKFAAERRNFGNGRFVDKLLQKALTKHATREHVDDEDLLTLKRESVPDVSEVMASFGRFSSL